MKRAKQWVASMTVGLVATSFAPFAQATPESDAKDLFARARDLRASNDCASAAPLFAKAYKIYPDGLGSLRNFAECEEQLGHFASSRRSWLDLKRAIIAHPPDVKYDGWDKDAEQAAARLKPRVASFVVDVTLTTPQGDAPANEQSGVELAINGESLGTALVGTPLERDPGTYRVRASTQYAEPVEQQVTIHAGENPHVTLHLTKTPPAKPIDTAVSTTTTTVPDDHPVRRTVGYVATGVGAGLIIGSVVTLLVRNSAKSDLDSACPTHAGCPESLRDTVDRGKTMSTLTSVLLPVGIVGVAVGIPLILTSRAKKHPSAEVRVTPAFGGLGVSGRF